MKKLLILILVLAFVMPGCKYFKGNKGNEVDTTAAWQAKQDSIKNAEAVAAAKLQAQQDSLRRVQEYMAMNKFHVIIGSFKVPTNADNWQKEVANMGFNNAKIVESPNGFRMVSIASFDTYSKAFREINKINEGKEEPIELWVYEAN